MGLTSVKAAKAMKAAKAAKSMASGAKSMKAGKTAAEAMKSSQSLGAKKGLAKDGANNVGDMAKKKAKKPTELPGSDKEKVDREAQRKSAYEGAKQALLSVSKNKDYRQKAMDKFVTKGSAPKAKRGMKLKKKKS